MGKRSRRIRISLFYFRKNKNISAKGPIGKFFSENSLKDIMQMCKSKIGDSIFLACGDEKQIEKILSAAREKIAQELKLIDENKFAFCWIVDYPMFELDEKTKKIIFSHNPFSMPQGDVNKINFENL